MTSEINFLSTKVFSDIWKASKSGNYKLIEEKGSSRSSKTWSNFQVLFLDLYENPMTTCTILRDTQKSCREIIETDWVKWLSDPMGRKKQLEEKTISIQQFDEFIKEESLMRFFLRNKTNHTWTFLHNNSFIRFTGLDDEDDAMGMTQDICWINEPYKFSHEVYKQLSQRTSKYILFDWNPKQKHWIDEERRKDNTITLHSTFKDNPFCPKESRIQILSYQPVERTKVVLENVLSIDQAKNYNTETNDKLIDKKYLKELKRCQYNESTGSSSLYHWLVYGEGEKSEKPNRIFKGWKVIDDKLFNDLPYQSYYGLDFGLSAPSALVEMKFDGDRTFFLKERMYSPMNKLTGTLSEEFEHLGIEKHKEIICDSGNEINKSEGVKLRNSGYNVIFAKKGAGSISSGIETMQKADICFTKSSENLESEYESYSWKIWQGIQMDVPEDHGDDHILDAAKYVIVWYVKTRRLSI
jgi:phage terminase large subunit